MLSVGRIAIEKIRLLHFSFLYGATHMSRSVGFRLPGLHFQSCQKAEIEVLSEGPGSGALNVMQNFPKVHKAVQKMQVAGCRKYYTEVENAAQE